MSLRAFIAERRTVGEWTLRSPTVATFTRVLDLYRDEIETASRRGVGVDVQAVIRHLAGSPNDARVAAVLRTCVTGPEDGRPVARIVVALLGMVDLSVLLSHSPTGNIKAGPDDGARGICALARLYGCAPHEVMDWPITSYLEALRLSDSVDSSPHRVSSGRPMFQPGPNGPIN